MIFNNYEDDDSNQMNDYDEYEQKIELLNNKLEHLNSELENLEDTRDEIDDKIDNTQDFLEELDDHLEELNEELEENKDNIDDQKYKTLLRSQKEIIDKKGEYIEKLQLLRQRRLEISQKKNAIKNQINSTKAEIKLWKNKFKNRDSKKVRINFTLPKFMKDEWKDLADDLNLTVSQLIRNAMEIYEKSLTGERTPELDKQISELEKDSQNIEKDLEEKIEKKLKKYIEPLANLKFDFNSLKNLGDIELNGKKRGNSKSDSNQNSSKSEGSKIKINWSNPIDFMNDSGKIRKKSRTIGPDISLDVLKKRVKGLILLHKNIPIQKLAATLKLTEDEAENIIYELVAEDIVGTINDGVFEFEDEPNRVIEKINEIIDRYFG